MNGLLIFVKAPEPGRVKSRLAKDLGTKDLGAERAAELYRCFGLDWLARLVHLAQTYPDPISLRLVYSPADAGPAIATWLAPILTAHPAITQHPQRPGDLGDRLDGAFQDAFAAGITRAIAVGSDSPDAPTTALATGFTALSDLPSDLHTNPHANSHTNPHANSHTNPHANPHTDCVLAPATDGGYWAIGFRSDRYCPQVFAPMVWSVPTVAQKTRDRLRAAGRSVQELAMWSDVDDLAGLQALAMRLRSGMVQLPRTAACLAAMGEHGSRILTNVKSNVKSG
jgi:glycosyltransferase A (GT-A) superfamily protein (DUF2064 family)